MEDSNRIRILQAADELFNLRGYKSVTIGDLAEKLGMSKKTIYQYFSGKEEIATGVIETVMGRIGEKFDRLTPGDHPIDGLRAALEHVKNEVVRLNPLFLQDIQKYVPDLWQRLVQFRAENIMKIEHAIRGAQQMGIATELNPRLTTVIFLETVQALARPDSLARHGFSAKELIDTLIKLFIAGITSPANAATSDGIEDAPKQDIAEHDAPEQNTSEKHASAPDCAGNASEK